MSVGRSLDLLTARGVCDKRVSSHHRLSSLAAVQGYHINCSKTVSYNIIDCKNIVKKGAITTDLGWHNFVYLVAVTTPRVVNGATR